MDAPLASKLLNDNRKAQALSRSPTRQSLAFREGSSLTAGRIASSTMLASGDCAIPGQYAAVWNFGYDGDGGRVSQLYTAYVGGQAQTPVLTAYFLGGGYEVSGTLSGGTFTQSSMLKYYAVAGMTIAMNDGSGLTYLLTDHREAPRSRAAAEWVSARWWW